MLLKMENCGLSFEINAEFPCQLFFYSKIKLILRANIRRYNLKIVEQNPNRLVEYQYENSLNARFLIPFITFGKDNLMAIQNVE